MIQRIQSVYLLLAAIAMSLMLFFPLAEFMGGTEIYTLKIQGVYQDTNLIVSVFYMIIPVIAAAILSIVNIFLYKNRLMQIRICYVSGVFMLGAVLLVGYYIFRAYSSIAEFEVHAISYTVFDLMPFVALVFTWLANRGIIRDETLVKSLDRIR